MLTYKIKYQNQVFNCRQDETLIEAFNRHGIIVNFSCKKGSCHVCMMQCESGTIPEPSQKGLKSEYINSHYFLPCSCNPESDMSVISIKPESLFNSAIIHSKEILSVDICRILIEPGDAFNYKPGQYINLRRITSGTARSYSLVSHPDDYFIELHVKKMPNGELSSWIFDELKTGDEIQYQGPIGDSYYQQIENTDIPLILIGKGTGIAPLYGVLLDALRNSHSAQLSIYHEGYTADDLYLHDKLLSLDKQHSNINYFACVDEPLHNPISGNQISSNSALTLLENTLDEKLNSKLANTLNNTATPAFFTSGSPEFIASIKTLLKHHNIPGINIFSDSFDYKDLRAKAHTQSADLGRRRSDPAVINQQSTAKQILSHDDEMWNALKQGKKLKTILDDFYSQVYKDNQLSGFFRNTTQQRSSEKQYLFMRQIFTGEKVYFGDRPKNAHHWMVISNELFDYRESILSKCLRKHGLAEHLIKRWLAIDENFRQDIVKDAAFPKVVNGIEIPLNGYEQLTIDEGTLCDGCHGEINKGETVRYHLRLGLTYCPHCIESEQVV